jgi:adenylate cyclase
MMLLAGVVAAWVAYTSRALVLKFAEESVRAQALERAQAQYRRYLSGNVLDYVLENPSAMALGGSRRTASVMFVDIRNFTAFADRESPERVVEFLNTTFTQFVDVVFAHGGTLDKFLGDGLLAVFGAPRERSDAPEVAMAAAMAILDRVRALNAARGEGAHELRIGIGIAHGVVIAGNIGSEQRMEYTVVGDTVNFAARLQDLTKDMNCSVIVSESVFDAVRGTVPLRRLPPVRVRGKAGEIQLYGLPNEGAAGVEPSCPQAPVLLRSGAPPS